MDKFLNNAPIVITNNYHIPLNVIKLSGTNNTRHCNNFKTNNNNKKIKTNMLFRSDNLDKLNYQDVNKLKQMGVDLVIDLRNEKENKNNEIYKLFKTYKNIGTNLDELFQTELLLQLLEDEDDDDCEDLEDENFLGELSDIFKKVHVSFLDICSEQISNTIKTILNSNGKPVLIMSNFGKDRAGVIICVILMLLDIEWENIIEDYVYSNNSFKKILDDNVDEKNLIVALDKVKNNFPNQEIDILDNEKYLKEDIGDLKDILLAKKENLEAIKKSVIEEYTDINNFAKTQLNLSDKDIEKLKQIFLVDNNKDECKNTNLNKYTI